MTLDNKAKDLKTLKNESLRMKNSKKFPKSIVFSLIQTIKILPIFLEAAYL